MNQLRNLSFSLALVIASAGPGIISARAADATAPAKPKAHLAEGFVAPRVVDQLGLSAEQQTKFNDLTTEYQTALEKWKKDNNFDPQKQQADMQAAVAAGDKAKVKELRAQMKPMGDLRTQYQGKFRTLLTDEQKTKLDELLGARKSGGHRGKGGAGAPPPAS